MAVSQFEDIWKLMSEYTFEDDEDCINDNLKCLLCRNLMIDASQSDCGCRYCYNCIENYLEGEEDKYCPGVKTDCKEEYLKLEENFRRIPRINKQISKLKVKCPNQSCMCKIELIKMEEHLRVCTKQRLTCPFISIGCEDEGGPKDSVVTHLHDDTFTHTKLLMECIQNMKNDFEDLKDSFEMSKLEISSLKDESRLKDIQIMEQMEVFKEESRNKEMEIMEQINILKGDNRSLKEELRLKEIQIKEIIEQIDFIKEESRNKEINKEIIENQNEEIQLLKEELKEMKNGVDLRLSVMAEDKDKRESKVKEEQRKEITELLNKEVNKERENNSLKLFPNIDADFIWKIDELTKKRQTEEEYYSQPFYSKDYNLCLSVYFIGDYIYLCSWIIKGDYDDKVEWPFNKYITVGIVDTQSRTVFKSIKLHNDNQYKYNKEAFNKPNMKRNNYPIYFRDENIKRGYLYGFYYGSPFIIYSGLKKERPLCLKNNCLFVFCLLSDN